MKKRILSLLLCLVMALALLPKVMSEAENPNTTTADDVANYNPNFRFDESTGILSWDPCPGQNSYYFIFEETGGMRTSEPQVNIRDFMINEHRGLLSVDPVTNKLFISASIWYKFKLFIDYTEAHPVTGAPESKTETYQKIIEFTEDYPAAGYSYGKDITALS